MNTVIFSDYDSGFRSSAVLLRDDVDWGLINRYMYKEQIPRADEIVDYDDEKLFTFFQGSVQRVHRAHCHHCRWRGRKGSV